MKVAAELLGGYVPLPDDPAALRDLLDDLGLEVKRVEASPLGPIFTLELLANRGDHHGYLGIAREIAARTGAEVRHPPLAVLAPGEGPVRVINETPLCLVYTATLLVLDGEARPLPQDDLRLLEAAGIHSVSAPVDATNLANLELGQPTHAFDADTIAGPIRIRTSTPGEQAWPLFTEGRVTLPEGTLVIADDEKVLAVAGVIGCEESKTTEATRRVVLESATFDPVAVRRASRALNIHTDSSARFERGADPTAPLQGAGRVAHLLGRAGWRVQGPTVQVGDWRDPRREIRVDVERLARFLGLDLDEGEIRRRLQPLGFAVGQGDPLPLTVPPHRLWDVEHAADIAEELARTIGYAASPETLPPVGQGALLTHAERVREKVDQVLVGQGFYEVITDGFHGRDLREKLGLEEGHPLFAHVETLNAVDRGYSLVKNQCLGQAVEAVALNLRERNPRVKAYEWTRTFHPDPDADNGVCTERRVLWMVSCGPSSPPGWAGRPPAADAHHLKGVLHEIGVELGLDLALGPADPKAPLHDLLHPHRQATITLDGQAVGILGEVHPGVCQRFRIKRERPCYLEVAVEALEAEGQRPAYHEPPEHHPIERSLAFTLPDRFPAGQVADVLREAGPPWLTAVDIVEVYPHELEGRQVRTVTYALTYSSEGAARTADEVNAASEALVREVHARFSAQGVHLR